MARRQFLQLLGGVALAACGSPTAGDAARRSGDVRAVAFDIFTLFDPRGVDRRVAAVVGDVPAFTATWKARLFEYCFVRAASGRYADFEHLVRDALIHAAHAHGIDLSDPRRAELEAAFTELAPWPDTAAVLRDLRARGIRLAPLSNFAPTMIDGLLARAALGDLFDARISTDRARTFKPDPRAYALAETTFGLPRDRIAFAAFAGWDVAGARWFGFPTFWVDRLGATPDELVAADASGPDLQHLAAWITDRAGGRR